MSITREDVLHVAKLARLELSDDEIGAMQRDLDSIIGYVALLSELDTSQIEPTAHVAVEQAPLRPDEPRVGLSHEAALAEAPRAVEGGFLVPSFMEEP
jgi:aspartyl-tRNA(Asn)/glutamyl-tRNA(Gln) amidotransferase subunit C